MRAAPIVLVVGLAAGCVPGPGTPPPPSPIPSPTASLEPVSARFEVGFNLLRVTGVSCSGVSGPWRVRFRTPSPIEGKGVSRFRLPKGNHPGQLEWSFTASHPTQGTVTYAGDVRVHRVGTLTNPALTFTGTQTAVGATGRISARAKVRPGGECE